jgi:hypothetical protein
MLHFLADRHGDWFTRLVTARLVTARFFVCVTTGKGRQLVNSATPHSLAEFISK